jgi:hypothetical protein
MRNDQTVWKLLVRGSVFMVVLTTHSRLKWSIFCADSVVQYSVKAVLPLVWLSRVQDDKHPASRDKSKRSLHPVIQGVRHATPFRPITLHGLQYRARSRWLCVRCQWGASARCAGRPSSSRDPSVLPLTLNGSHDSKPLNCLINQSTDTLAWLSYPQDSLFCCWFVYESVQ